jgi:sugar phosphate isomerase/epimerase
MRKQNQELSRRDFLKDAAIGAGALAFGRGDLSAAEQTAGKLLRLGGPVFEKSSSPDEWTAAVKRLGYRAAYCPIEEKEPDDVVKAYEKAAKKADIVIAEVGAWGNNPIAPEEKTRKNSIANCQKQLALAERIGANCCVNVSGSRNPKSWAGQHAENLTKETFDMIVESVRTIIDGVKPTRTFYTLETGMWWYPESADSYLRLIKAIDRKQLGVHLDPTNLIYSPPLYYSNGKVISECFEKLGPMIKSCHAKDVKLGQGALAHLDEIRPGLGGLDYKTFLKELSKYPDTPLMIEHLKDAEEYRQAAEHIRSVAQEVGLSFG